MSLDNPVSTKTIEPQFYTVPISSIPDDIRKHSILARTKMECNCEIISHVPPSAVECLKLFNGDLADMNNLRRILVGFNFWEMERFPKKIQQVFYQLGRSGKSIDTILSGFKPEKVKELRIFFDAGKGKWTDKLICLTAIVHGCHGLFAQYYGKSGISLEKCFGSAFRHNQKFMMNIIMEHGFKPDCFEMNLHDVLTVDIETLIFAIDIGVQCKPFEILNLDGDREPLPELSSDGTRAVVDFLRFGDTSVESVSALMLQLGIHPGHAGPTNPQESVYWFAINGQLDKLKFIKKFLIDHLQVPVTRNGFPFSAEVIEDGADNQEALLYYISNFL